MTKKIANPHYTSQDKIEAASMPALNQWIKDYLRLGGIDVDGAALRMEGLDLVVVTKQGEVIRLKDVFAADIEQLVGAVVIEEEGQLPAEAEELDEIETAAGPLLDLHHLIYPVQPQTASLDAPLIVTNDLVTVDVSLRYLTPNLLSLENEFLVGEQADRDFRTSLDRLPFSGELVSILTNVPNRLSVIPSASVTADIDGLVSSQGSGSGTVDNSSGDVDNSGGDDGNDRFVLRDQSGDGQVLDGEDFDQINGGIGFDILAIEDDSGLHLEVITANRLQNIEAIDLINGHINVVTLNAENLINLSTSNAIEDDPALGTIANSILIRGDADDIIVFSQLPVDHPFGLNTHNWQVLDPQDFIITDASGVTSTYRRWDYALNNGGEALGSVFINVDVDARNSLIAGRSAPEISPAAPDAGVSHSDQSDALALLLNSVVDDVVALPNLADIPSVDLDGGSRVNSPTMELQPIANFLFAATSATAFALAVGPLQVQTSQTVGSLPVFGDTSAAPNSQFATMSQSLEELTPRHPAM